MKKKMKDLTFSEFVSWCNKRACDGAWSITMAVVCIEAMEKVKKVKPLFRRRKAQEKEWERIKGEYFVLDAEYELT